MVIAAQETDWSEQLWGQVISGVSLGVVTFAIYGTGERAYTVKRQFTSGTGDAAKTYAVNTILSEGEYNALGEAHKENIKSQRGLYFRALYTGEDGRWSTSKMQVLLWTYAVLYGLLAVFVAMQLNGAFNLDLPGDEVGEAFSDLEFHEQYLLLLGGYFAAAVLAKGITNSQVEGGEPKPQVEEVPSPGEGVRNLVSDDAGKTDLGDTQFFLFNLLALTVFFVSFVPHLEQGLPELPEFLVALTSVSALAYVGKKSLESRTPKIAAVVPSKARRGDPLRIEGSYLAASTTATPSVMIDGIAIDQSDVEIVSASGTLGQESVLRVTVPDAATAGTDKPVSVRPEGATAPATANIEIVEVKIDAVDPEPVPWRSGVLVTITGSGFGPDPGDGEREVYLGTCSFVVTEWKDGRIVGKIESPPEPAEPAEDRVVLKLSRQSETLVERATSVALTVMAVIDVEPKPVPLLAGTPLKLTGTDFGPPPGGEVHLGETALERQTWSDTLIVAVLGEEFPSTDPPPDRLALKVNREGYAEGGLPVEVSLPAVTVTEVHPSEIPAKEGTPVAVHGSGFGREDQLSVRIGEVPLQIQDAGRSDALLQTTVGAVPDEVSGTAADNPVTSTLVVEREHWKPGSKPVTLSSPN